MNQEQPEQKKVLDLSRAININETLASILVQRYISTYEEAKNYFRPSLENLHDPFLMKDMDKAVERLEKAILRKEKILIYGDYDVDGATSVALCYGFLKNYCSTIDFYIPDRYKEGYGISKQGIKWAVDNNFELIICLDCGIKAIDKVREAKEKGVDFIICDHHNPGKEIPPAKAILDPKREDCNYPYKELSACGVGFKFLQAFCIKTNQGFQHLYSGFDLVAISIAADLVPLTGENRILAYLGLKELNKQPSPGLSALMADRKNSTAISISDIVFGIGPRINSAGRIEHAKSAVDLLISENKEEAKQLAAYINQKNTLRRDFDTQITQEAIEMIEEKERRRKAKSTILYKEDWHKGVIGIVASRCIEKFYRPTVILTKSNEKITGSARSVVNFDIYQAISACSDLLDQYGGHTYAAGLTLDPENLEAFTQKFEKVVENTIQDEQLIPQLLIDQTINLDRINYRFYNILKQMAPFGPQNMRPVFRTNQVYVSERPRILKNNHLRFVVRQEGFSPKVEAIGFGMADYFELITSGMRFSVAYTIEENNFIGNKFLQINVKDIKFD
ncbi:single-stranded-DNA-specific exonuclease RecJ [Cytophagales bacterium RKSG123]|nr:single-stranded-DNA-specific exonuclease RecJ [Xanthovirga aplysinae]